MFQTCHGELQATGPATEKMLVLGQVNKLLRLLLDMLKGHPNVHFSALCAINRVIDLCILHRVYHPWQWEEDGATSTTPHVNVKPAHTLVVGSSPLDPGKHRCVSRSASGWSDHEGAASNPVHAQLEKILQGSPLPGKSSPRGLRPSSWKSKPADSVKGTPRTLQHQESCQNIKETSFIDSGGGCSEASNVEVVPGTAVSDTDCTPLETLSSAEPGPLLEVLKQAITLHKQTMGTRHKCTPSIRWRHCHHHCLQILAARVLAVMCHGQAAPHKLVNDAHIRILVDALDPNHDPVSSNTYPSKHGTFDQCCFDVGPPS